MSIARVEWYEFPHHQFLSHLLQVKFYIPGYRSSESYLNPGYHSEFSSSLFIFFYCADSAHDPSDQIRERALTQIETFYKIADVYVWLSLRYVTSRSHLLKLIFRFPTEFPDGNFAKDYAQDLMCPFQPPFFLTLRTLISEYLYSAPTPSQSRHERKRKLKLKTEKQGKGKEKRLRASGDSAQRGRSSDKHEKRKRR